VPRIGIDFDNTIAGFDDVFASAAVELGLLDPGYAGSKKEVRDAIRRQPDGDEKWIRLQGHVYGARMADARLIDGVDEFLKSCRQMGIEVCIVSHKTRYGHFDPRRIDLHKVARTWMATHGFFEADGFGIDPGNVYFEPTHAAKIERIRAINCTHFVDDLEECLRNPDFPAGVVRYLYAAGYAEVPQGPFRAFRSWSELADDVIPGIGRVASVSRRDGGKASA